MNAKRKVILFIGPPGCGKGTNAKLLSEINSEYLHLSTGELARKKFTNNNCLANGDLCSDDDITKLLLSEIAENKDIKYIILDGFPRTLNQFLFCIKHFNIVAIYIFQILNIDHIIKRIEKRSKEENRQEDQKKDVLLKRYKIYNDFLSEIIKSEHLIQNRIFFINADHTLEKVFKQVLFSVEFL